MYCLCNHLLNIGYSWIPVCYAQYYQILHVESRGNGSLLIGFYQDECGLIGTPQPDFAILFTTNVCIIFPVFESCDSLSPLTV